MAKKPPRSKLPKKKRTPYDREQYLVRTYGLTVAMFDSLVLAQSGMCAVCGGQLTSVHVDHKHVPGYKQLSPEGKARYVRGLTCWTCNFHKVGKNTVESARAVLAYLLDPPAQQVLYLPLPPLPPLPPPPRRTGETGGADRPPPPPPLPPPPETTRPPT